MRVVALACPFAHPLTAQVNEFTRMYARLLEQRGLSHRVPMKLNEASNCMASSWRFPPRSPQLLVAVLAAVSVRRSRAIRMPATSGACERGMLRLASAPRLCSDSSRAGAVWRVLGPSTCCLAARPARPRTSLATARHASSCCRCAVVPHQQGSCHVVLTVRWCARSDRRPRRTHRPLGPTLRRSPCCTAEGTTSCEID